MTTPTIIAHRGASGLAPENTLAAFRKAIALDADGIEFDLHLTADGAVVVHHDFRMSRYWARQNGEWLADVGPALRDMTLDELRAYDIGRLAPGSDYAARYPDYSPEDGAVAPTFDEVLDLVNASAPPDFQLWVELKLAPADQEPTSDPNALAEDAVVALEASGLAARATIISFYWPALYHAQRRAPGAGRANGLSLRRASLDEQSASRPAGSFAVDGALRRQGLRGLCRVYDQGRRRRARTSAL